MSDPLGEFAIHAGIRIDGCDRANVLRVARKIQPRANADLQNLAGKEQSRNSFRILELAEGREPSGFAAPDGLRPSAKSGSYFGAVPNLGQLFISMLVPMRLVDQTVVERWEDDFRVDAHRLLSHFLKKPPWRISVALDSVV